MLHEMENEEDLRHEPEAASPAAGRGGAPRPTKLEPGFRLNCENAADACLRDGDDPPPPAIAPIVGDSSWWRSGDESSVQKVDGEKVVETPLIAGLGPPPTTDGRAAEPPAPLGCPSAAAVAASPLWPFSPWSRPVAAAATGRNGASAGGGGGGGDGASAERSGGGSSRSRQAGVTRRGDATRGGRRGRAAAGARCGCVRVRCAAHRLSTRRKAQRRADCGGSATPGSPPIRSRPRAAAAPATGAGFPSRS